MMKVTQLKDNNDTLLLSCFYLKQKSTQLLSNMTFTRIALWPSLLLRTWNSLCLKHLCIESHIYTQYQSKVWTHLVIQGILSTSFEWGGVSKLLSGTVSKDACFFYFLYGAIVSWYYSGSSISSALANLCIAVVFDSVGDGTVLDLSNPHPLCECLLLPVNAWSDWI